LIASSEKKSRSSISSPREFDKIARERTEVTRAQGESQTTMLQALGCVP
jgi:hypothetical protein